MYEDFYHLSSNPFRLAPDPKFRFSHPSYDEANAYLEYALKLGEGFVIFTGRPGTGKTTLVQTFLGRLEATQVVAARIAVPNLNAADLLRAVAYAYQVDAEGLDMASVLRLLERFFIQQVRAGKRVLLIVDEAQGLSPDALEELRLLADLQTESRFLLQIFLVGQEHLRELMVIPEMEQFQQRVTGTCKLNPLGLQETRDYVEYRLCQVGWSGDPELTGPAVNAIYEYSGGIPRHINKVCTRLLLLQGLMGNKHVLDESDVLEVAKGLKDEQLAPLQSKQSTDETTNPAAVFEKLALRAPTEAAKLHSPSPEKYGQRASTDRNTRAARVNKQRTPVRKPAENGAPWMSTGTDLYLRGKKKILAMRRQARKILEPAVVIGSMAGITLIMVILVFNGDNPDGDSNLLTSREDAYETWVQISKFRDGIYEEYPVYKEPDFVRENRARRSAMAAQPKQVAVVPAQEAKQVPVKHYSPVDIPAPEPVSVEPVVIGVAPVAENTVVTEASRSFSDDAGSDAVSVAFLAFPAAAEPDPDTTRDDKQDTGTENHNPENTLVAGYVSAGISEEIRSVPEQVVILHSPENEIARLLSLAADSLQENRLLIPSDKNAYAYYRQVEALDPGNSKAATGLDRIAERYVVLAKRAIDRDDTQKASRYIERGLQVRAANTDLLALQTTVLLASTAEVARSVPQQTAQESPVESRTLLSMLKKMFDNNEPRIVDPPIWHDDEETW